MSSLAVRASLCGDVVRVALVAGGGRLQQPGMLAIAARASLLIDLAAIGVLEPATDDASIALDGEGSAAPFAYFDPVTTGCASADALINYLGRHPKRSIDHLLRRGRPHLRAVAAELVNDGAWARPHLAAGRVPYRFEDASEAHFIAARRRVPVLLKGRVEPADAREASLAAIADVLGLCGRRDVDAPPSPLMLARLGGVAWIGGHLVEYLRTIRIRRQMAVEPGGGDG